MEKHSVLRLSYLFAHLYLLSSYSFSSDLLSSNLPLLSASALLCFSSVHIVGSLTSKLPSTTTTTTTTTTTRTRTSTTTTTTTATTTITAVLHYTTIQYLNGSTLQLQMQIQLQLKLHYINLHYTTLHYTNCITLRYDCNHHYIALHDTTQQLQPHYFTLQYTRLHHTMPRYSTQHYSTLQYTTLNTPQLQITTTATTLH